MSVGNKSGAPPVAIAASALARNRRLHNVFVYGAAAAVTMALVVAACFGAIATSQAIQNACRVIHFLCEVTGLEEVEQRCIIIGLCQRSRKCAVCRWFLLLEEESK